MTDTEVKHEVRVRGKRLSEHEVAALWNIVKEALEEVGFDVAQAAMPRDFNIVVQVPHKDFKRFYSVHENPDIEEHGRALSALDADGLIHGGWQDPSGDEPTIILVRKGAPHVKRTLCHELLHIFEVHLRVEPAALAVRFSKWWGEEQ